MPVKVWPPEILRYAKTSYLVRGVSSSTLLEMINKKFKTTYTKRQVYDLVAERGWAAKREELLQRVDKLQPAEAHRMVAESKRRAQADMEMFTKKSREVAVKAFDMAQNATSARELSAAASSASTMVKTYRLCAGLDAEPRGNGGAVFNFNFASSAPRPVAQEAAVDLDAS